MRGVWLVGLALLALGCGEDGASSGSGSGSRSGSDEPQDEGPSFVPIVGGVGWYVEEPFVQARPDNDMRDAQYRVDGAPGVVLTVSHFDPEVGGGGRVSRNVNRWVGQFERPGGREPTIEEREINDLQVTTVDVSGTFVGRQGMGPGGPPREGWRLLGAIVEGPHGLVFFKLLGPGPGVSTALEGFEQLVRSIHPA